MRCAFYILVIVRPAFRVARWVGMLAFKSFNGVIKSKGRVPRCAPNTKDPFSLPALRFSAARQCFGM